MDESSLADHEVDDDLGYRKYVPYIEKRIGLSDWNGAGG